MSFGQLGGSAAAETRKIHLQTMPGHGEQVHRPEYKVSQESLRRVLHGRHVRQPPSELEHLLGCRPAQPAVHVEVAVVSTP